MEVPRPRKYMSLSHLHWICQILAAIVAGGVLFRYGWRDISDPFKCNALLNDGDWLNPGTAADPSAYGNWQPPGCMMRKYNKDEIEQCLAGQKFLVAGDSTSRQIFDAAITKMGYQLSQLQHGHDAKHQDAELHSGDATITFIWDPYLNSSRLEQELKSFRYEPSFADTNSSAALLFLRAPGLWHARHGRENYIEAYQADVDHIIPYADMNYMQELGGREESSNLLLVSPVLVPYYRELARERKATITPDRIQKMNEYLHLKSEYRELPILWSYSSMLAGTHNFGTHDKSGIHLIRNVAEVQVDVLLNLRCNAKMSKRGFPYDRTCCMSYKKIGGIQLLFAAWSGFALLFLTWSWAKSLLFPDLRSQTLRSLKGVMTISLVLSFCFIADRTHVFEKGQKQFSRMEFGASCIAAAILGLASLRPIKKIARQSGISDDLFLSRDQTDEWKGWMQALILLYHYAGASQSPATYKVVRLLVSAYLFMTGYGHTLSLMQKQDFSLKKTAAVVLRLNVLTVALSYIMETNYLFYYFPALSTLWYMVIFLVLRIGYTHNHSIFFLGCKIVSAVLLTTAFIKIPGIMEAIASCLQFIFRIKWDIPEWRFRLSLDLYIVYVGMIAAIFRQKSLLQRQSQELEPVIERSRSGFLVPLLNGISSPDRISVSLMTILSLGFLLVARSFPDKVEYNRVHPYISWIPILGFVMLRNSHELLKAYYSTAFAWLGQISLETYVLQYHIWLAGDTKGILRMGLFNRGVEAAILSPLFLWVSWHASEATRVVVRQLIEVGKKEVDRNTEQEEGHALISHEDTANDPDSHAEAPDEKVQNSSKSSLLFFPCIGAVSVANAVLGDLKWRLFIMVAVLWMMNLLSDKQLRSAQ